MRSTAGLCRACLPASSVGIQSRDRSAQAPTVAAQDPVLLLSNSKHLQRRTACPHAGQACFAAIACPHVSPRRLCHARAGCRLMRSCERRGRRLRRGRQPGAGGGGDPDLYPRVTGRGARARRRFQALAVRAWLLGGAQVEISDAESQIFVTSLDQARAPLGGGRLRPRAGGRCGIALCTLSARSMRSMGGRASASATIRISV